MPLRKIIFRLTTFLLFLYVIVCTLVWFNQEKLLFHPKKLAPDHHLNFPVFFEELTFSTSDQHQLNGALFRSSDTTAGLIFFLHGNAGNLENYRGTAEFYQSLGYDFFLFDYRGFGKSTGTIESEEQFYADAQLVYDTLKKRYAEKDIVVIGYSVGTATAAMLAAKNHPEKLVLMAPYYSMENMAAYQYRIFPSFLVEYKFETYRFLPKVKAPVCIFHGRNDGSIPFYSSKMLAGLLKKGDRFIPLSDQGHNGMESHPVFVRELKQFLQSN